MEEAPVVVTAATGTLGPVVAKLSTLLLRRHGEYQLRRRTRKDVKLIRSKLKSIHSILWVIWEREDLDAEGKELRMEAWRLADDMDDAIDDFMQDGKRLLQDKAQPSRPFKDLKGRAVDVYERCRNKWKTEISRTTFSSLCSRTKTTVDSGPGKRRTRVVDPYVRKDISELEDMKEPRDKLIQHLLVGEEKSTPQLKMASILGPAGVGKTTLARLVLEAIEDKFQARAFVSITSCHNMTEVLTSILGQLAADSAAALVARTKAATKNKHIIDAISSFLKDKRYLVIIDDIWHYGEWETIKKSLPDNNMGSRIVTTSRVISIADKWCDDFDALVYEIDRRTSWDGYGTQDTTTTKMIDMNADIIGEGFDRDHGIVKMCRGMPLAVSCMISALEMERERQEEQRLWLCVETRDVQDRIVEQVKRNGIQNTPGFEPLVETLELGYNHLPHHMLKTCLLYCSIYPEVHRFTRDDLIRRWIAQGFISKEETAKDYFNELISRGWIGKVEYHNYIMHLMIRNYLRQKLREDSFINCTSDGISSSLIGRLCIDYWPSSDAVAEDPLSGIDWPHIRSLVVVKDAERVPYKHFQHLRVLDVGPCKVLENQHMKYMCGMLRLRHLFVSGGRLWPHWKSNITEIPREIVGLQYLETLEVTATNITRLPAQIGGLKQLKTLYMSMSFDLLELPREMGNLQHLETLGIGNSDITKQAWEIIVALKNLKTLYLSKNYGLSGIPRDIGELQQLKNLYVLSGLRITELPKEIGKLQHLEILDVSGTEITELPSEIGDLQRLQILNFSQLSKITKLPRDIWRLQQLEELHLWGTNVRKIPREIGGLKKLKNLNANTDGTLPFEAGQLSKLKQLPKCINKAWRNSGLHSSVAGEIVSFETGSVIDDGGLIVGTKHMHIPQWIKEHFNNFGSLDIRICKLEEQDLKVLREMPCLWSLTLRFEAVPRKPIAISGGGFARLVFLRVDSRVPRIIFQEGAMLRLKLLKFEFQFYSGPPNTVHPMGIKHLVCLEEVNFRCNEWYRGDSPCISATIDIVRKEALEHPNKPIEIILDYNTEDTDDDNSEDIDENTEDTDDNSEDIDKNTEDTDDDNSEDIDDNTEEIDDNTEDMEDIFYTTQLHK